MSPLQKQSIINRSHFPTLCQGKGTMTAFVLFVQHCTDPSSCNQEGFFKLASLFYGKKVQEGLESNSLMYFFSDNLEGNGSKSVRKRGASIQALKCSFLINQVLWVIMYIEEGSTPLIDFID